MHGARCGADGQRTAGPAPTPPRTGRGGRGMPAQQAAAPRERRCRIDGKNKCLCPVAAPCLIFFYSLFVFVS
jgi:hypothetical protein